MELKPYQQGVINDLSTFLTTLQDSKTPAEAYKIYWENKLGFKSRQLLDGSWEGMKPYQDNVPNAAHIAVKVPTAGGKTFIAVNALHTLDQYFNQGNAKAVVWLVPWSNLLQQTVANLSNPDHPYRQKLNALFGNRVGVYEKAQLLQGANFNPSTATEQLNIFVFNFASLRVNSRKKDDRKVYQENGALEPFRHLIDQSQVLADTDETALINVIRSLNPVVIVDESHNAETDLSKEMLQNLNPSLVLELTATPRKSSNIISFVSAFALKKENMVKLPVIVYNHHKKEEVISNALHLRRELEIIAEDEEKETGKSIRPIILFQAQSNIKGKNNTTFAKIKEKLLKLGIEEDEIKIKTAQIDELKGIDLSAKDCRVKYIITINALKEGWDCPNAYILASLADKSSPVEVEQILGRVLRQPYVMQHQSALLNMSYVLTASAKFNDTLDNIVKGLQESGFSRDDYVAEELPLATDDENTVLQDDLFTPQNPNMETTPSDEDFEVDEISFNSHDTMTPSTTNATIAALTEKAKAEGEAFSRSVQSSEVNENATLMSEAMNKTPKSYQIKSEFKQIADNLCLPQFVIRNTDELQSSLFPDLNEKWQLLHKDRLLDNFKLTECNTKLVFDDITREIRAVDIDEQRGNAEIKTIGERAQAIMTEKILSAPQDSQVEKLSRYIVEKLGDMTPIRQQDLQVYVNRVFENLDGEQVRNVLNNDFVFVKKLKDKIKRLTEEYAQNRFQVMIDSNKIKTEPRFDFHERITPLRLSTSISCSLYEREGDMNDYEQKMVLDIAGLENIIFWHRNLERGKGFVINGFISHYPDIICYTKSGNVVLIETKGDHLTTPESRSKNRLGKKWAQLAGEQFKYFMVFQSKTVEDTYTASSIIEVLREL